MKILVIDAKSETIHFSVYLRETLKMISFGWVENIGSYNSRITINVRHDGRKEQHVEIKRMRDLFYGLQKIIDMLQDEHVDVIKDKSEITLVGHRVVHGGEYYSSPVVINKEVKKKIKRLITLAPYHNQYNFTAIDVCQTLLFRATHIAVFDTAFHQTIPGIAFKYPLPTKFYEKYGIRAYGTHGISHQWVLKRTAEILNKEVDEVTMISIHLDNECSIAAIKDGECVDTSGGLNPLSGLLMGTLSGDIDPGVIFHLNKNMGMKMKDIEQMIYHDSGIKAISGEDNLMELIKEVGNGDSNAKLSFEMFCYRLKKYIGMYMAVLGGADAVVFTSEVGENSAIIRKCSLHNLGTLGILIDEEKNEQATGQFLDISNTDSKTKVLVVPTNIQREIVISVNSILEAVPS